MLEIVGSILLILCIYLERQYLNTKAELDSIKEAAEKKEFLDSYTENEYEGYFQELQETPSETAARYACYARGDFASLTTSKKTSDLLRKIWPSR